MYELMLFFFSLNSTLVHMSLFFKKKKGFKRMKNVLKMEKQLILVENGTREFSSVTKRLRGRKEMKKIV